MTRSDLEKLATIECKLCAVLMDVFQQNKPERKVILCQHEGEADLCWHPPLMRCPKARAEVALRFGNDPRPRSPITSSDGRDARGGFDRLADEKSLDRKPYKKPRQRPDW